MLFLSPHPEPQWMPQYIHHSVYLISKVNISIYLNISQYISTYLNISQYCQSIYIYIYQSTDLQSTWTCAMQIYRCRKIGKYRGIIIVHYHPGSIFCPSISLHPVWNQEITTNTMMSSRSHSAITPWVSVSNGLPQWHLQMESPWIPYFQTKPD